MPELPVARAVWKCRPNFEDACAAWIYAGGAHHTGFSQAVTTEMIEDFATMPASELAIIDAKTNVRDFQQTLRNKKFITRCAADGWARIKVTAQYNIGLDYGTNSVRALIVKSPAARRPPRLHGRTRIGREGVILCARPEPRTTASAIMSTARRLPSNKRSPPRRKASRL